MFVQLSNNWKNISLTCCKKQNKTIEFVFNLQIKLKTLLLVLIIFQLVLLSTVTRSESLKTPFSILTFILTVSTCQIH